VTLNANAECSSQTASSTLGPRSAARSTPASGQTSPRRRRSDQCGQSPAESRDRSRFKRTDERRDWFSDRRSRVPTGTERRLWRAIQALRGAYNQERRHSSTGTSRPENTLVKPSTSPNQSGSLLLRLNRKQSVNRSKSSGTHSQSKKTLRTWMWSARQ